MKKLLLAVLISTPVAVLAQITGSTMLMVGTPQSLLSGCTVSSSNSSKCSLPSGWTLAIAQGFETGSIGPNEYLGAGGNANTISGTNPHTGSKSLACNISYDGATCQWAVFPQTVIAGSNHIYVSYWRYMDSNACGDTEIYFWDVYTGNRSTFFNVEDTQNYTSPLNTCASSMQPAMIGDGTNIFADVTGKSWNLPKGTWEQVEGEYKGSTCTGGVSNNDGLYRLYINGQVVAQHVNFNLNGCGTGTDSTGMAVEAGGVFTYLGTNGSTSITPPSGSFNVYIDDVILLKQ
jgi:hypothetical protein